MKFVGAQGKLSVPPSVKNWIRTLQGLKCIWKRLRKEGWTFLCPRRLNQDPLENFFCCVRSQGFRNVNPTCDSFISSFKSLIINNFLSSHSVGANCEYTPEDALDTLRNFVDTLRNFVTNVSLPGPANIKSISNTANDNFHEAMCDDHSKRKKHPSITDKQYYLSTAVKRYVSGYLARKLVHETKYCKICRCILMSSATESVAQEEIAENFVISSRSYSPKALCYPSTKFSQTFRRISEISASLLPIWCHDENVGKQIVTEIYNSVDMSFMMCKEHDLKKLFTRLSVRLLIHAWCKNVNKILSGRDVHRIHASSRLLQDPIKKQALQKFVKRSCRKSEAM